MDARAECLIKCTDAVGGEKEDTGVVFQRPQENF